MMMSREQGQAIAALMSALREGWDEPGCLTAVAAVKDRDPLDVAMAAVRLCATPEVRTPGALKVDGPHWRERVGAPPKLNSDDWCWTCNYTERVCRQLYSTDHEFVSVGKRRPTRQEEPQPLPIHRTEAGYPRCSTCDGGGCLDCTDPA